MDAPSTLANQLLIALPTLADPNFSRSVALVCQHDADGAMGVVINRASEYTLGEVFRQMGIDSDDGGLKARQVLAGGPVHPERGFVIHDGAREWDSSLAIADGLYVTTSRDVLEAMARGDGFELCRVITKSEPRLEDPIVKSRVDQRLLDQYFSLLTTKYTHPRLSVPVSVE